MIDWKNYFDHVFCLHYAGYTDRIPRVSSELKRIGLLGNDIFSFHTTINDKHNQLIMNGLNLKDSLLNNPGYFDCQYGHYQILCESILSKYQRILVIEDDVVFLKDIENIENILENTPKDSDLVLYDYWEYDQLNNIIREDSSELFSVLFQNNSSNRYHSSSLYSMSLKYMNQYKNMLEQEFYPFDQLWNLIRNLSGLNTFKSNKHVGIQKDFSNALSKKFWNSTAENIYLKQGLDLKDYSTYE